MERFVVEGIELQTSAAKAFRYVAERGNLPAWTRAFTRVDHERATMATPAGEVDVRLRVRAAREEGTVDWEMTFPDGSLATAYSRVVPLDATRCAYTFVLTAPPVPLQELEGTLDAQAETLREEMRTLREILEGR
jgi:hypothetical protein